MGVGVLMALSTKTPAASEEVDLEQKYEKMQRTRQTSLTQTLAANLATNLISNTQKDQENIRSAGCLRDQNHCAMRDDIKMVMPAHDPYNYVKQNPTKSPTAHTPSSVFTTLTGS